MKNILTLIFLSLAISTQSQYASLADTYELSTAVKNYQDSSGQYQIHYKFDWRSATIPLTLPPGDPHYDAEITVYKVDGNIMTQVCEPFQGTYVENGCFEDVPKHWVDYALNCSKQPQIITTLVDEDPLEGIIIESPLQMELQDTGTFWILMGDPQSAKWEVLEESNDYTSPFDKGSFFVGVNSDVLGLTIWAVGLSPFIGYAISDRGILFGSMYYAPDPRVSTFTAGYDHRIYRSLYAGAALNVYGETSNWNKAISFEVGVIKPIWKWLLISPKIQLIETWNKDIDHLHFTTTVSFAVKI